MSAAGGAAGGAAAGMYNSKIKYSVAKEGDKEYFFAHYPDRDKPRREQRIIRIAPEHMAKWDASMHRLTVRASIGLVGMFVAAIMAVALLAWSGIHLWIFYQLGLFMGSIFILCLPFYFWMRAVDIREREVRKEILKAYGTFDVDRVSTVWRRLRGDTEAKPLSADYLLMKYDEVL